MRRLAETKRRRTGCNFVRGHRPRSVCPVRSPARRTCQVRVNRAPLVCQEAPRKWRTAGRFMLLSVAWACYFRVSTNENSGSISRS